MRQRVNSVGIVTVIKFDKFQLLYNTVGYIGLWNNEHKGYFCIEVDVRD